ncbi:MAG: DUF805 domain-containing protein [Fibromonadales bacterium]|nr:DUF805 domain-containing protein [Fibromonadales bacterium]
MLKCKECGREYADGEIFCANDGSKLIEKSPHPAPKPNTSFWKCYAKSIGINFKGRAQRKEFWPFAILYIVFAVIHISVNTSSYGDGYLCVYHPLAFFFYEWTRYHTLDCIITLSFSYCLVMFLPCLGVLVRRLHDVNRSGKYALLMLVPIIGWIVLLILLCLEGGSAENEYGINPKNP